ncbi:gamma-glutamyltransferase family protein [SAR202 cluster bacterium AD-804-J14_MRT_500m]|nr:gamma-glutamyltransferase family protein [SAR202 cluster bacterium AD-804-J14_MRT_500m]
MTSGQSQVNLEQGDSSLPKTGRPVIYGTEGVISSGHYLTSMAGMQMLINNGNAFDALIAAGFAAAVVEPIASYSLAAEGVFMLYDKNSGDILSLSGQGVAPQKATLRFYKSQGIDRIPTGPGTQAHLSFTVPGVVDAFLSLLERYGTKSVHEILSPAIKYAEYGIANYEYMLDRLRSPDTQQQFQHYPPGGMEIFYDNGQIPKPGSILVQKALAETMKKMIGGGNERISGIRYARSAFYEGDIAQAIVTCSQRVGGLLTLEDLSAYRAKFEAPARISYRGYEILGQGTWTQAPVLLQTLKILENYDLKSMGHNSAAYIHTITEALKLAFGDREAYYGDPDFADVPLDGLLSSSYATERLQLIDHRNALTEQAAAGQPDRFTKYKPPQVIPKARFAGSHGTPNADTSGTTHVATADKMGNMVCGTISGGAFNKSVFFPELGCCLSTRIEMFNNVEGHPNVIEPKKRPRTTLVNYIVLENGNPTMTFGCPGGDNQAQANLQLMLNVLVFEMNPQQAVEASRFSSQNVVNSFFPHVYEPGRLDLEEQIPDSTARELSSLGHTIRKVANCGMGATVNRRDPEIGVLSSSGDPRRSCYAIGW